ncbi:MAG: AI-2E family transporter [Chloroflexota bacterium]|nr:AI-2E family transporter [Chloroflexota bacterium]
MNNTNPENNSVNQESPNWNWTTKLVFGLVLVGLAIWLLVQFQNFLGPIISAFILAYLIHPIAKFIQEKIKMPWRVSVTLIYIILVLAILGLITWGGIALVEQVQNLIQFIDNNIDKLPDLVAQITEQTYRIGPFSFSLSGLNWDEITNQVVGAIQPVLGQLGSLASSIAAGAASIISWLILILLVSYFLLEESEGIRSQLLNITIPRYTNDFNHIGIELNRIWNGFMRGEILVVLFSLIIYTVVLGVLGLQFFFGLALIAAVGQLIPYVGAWITWISFGLVALFQLNIPFGIAPGIYMIIVLGVSMVFNTIIDNILRTKVMSENLRVHPALVLIGALIGVQLFGFVGIIIAAPVMASFNLFLNYIIKKLNDQDPWVEVEVEKPVEKQKWTAYLVDQWGKFIQWIKTQWKKLMNRRIDPKAEKSRPNPHQDETEK